MTLNGHFPLKSLFGSAWVCLFWLYGKTVRKPVEVRCKFYADFLWGSLKREGQGENLQLAAALIQSRLDYSNSALYGTSTSNIRKLQVVQNALSRIITCSSRSVPTSQLLSNLDWLYIHKRIIFKVVTLTYKVLTTQQPAYLHNLISYHQRSRSLRSSRQSLLQVPRATTDFGRRAFSSAAPQIWNHIRTAIKVSPSLDSFKRHLKTHYFTSP